jgi:hypothetical protein
MLWSSSSSGSTGQWDKRVLATTDGRLADEEGLELALSVEIEGLVVLVRPSVSALKTVLMTANLNMSDLVADVRVGRLTMTSFSAKTPAQVVVSAGTTAVVSTTSAIVVEAIGKGGIGVQDAMVYIIGLQAS